jgi:hypothetical protein
MSDLSSGKSVATKPKRREVEKFFSVVVDDFFSDPIAVKNYGKSLPMESQLEGNWPGRRTKALFHIDKGLNDAIVLKILSCYYDLTYQEVYWERSSLLFQEIPAFSQEKNDIRNKGWIHQDTEHENIYELAGLIYLNENIDPDSGTSLLKLVKDDYVTYHNHFAKNWLYENNKEYVEEYYTNEYSKHESFFIEKTRFQNIFNRLIMYDPNEFHRANSYFSLEKEPRLTLVYFIGGLTAGRYPMDRIKNEEYDLFINQKVQKL